MNGADSTIQQLAQAIATQSRLQSLMSNPPGGQALGSSPNPIVQQLASLAAAQQPANVFVQQPAQQLVNAQQLVSALAAQQQQQHQQRQQQVTALLQAAQQAQQGGQSSSVQQAVEQAVQQVAQQLTASAPPALSPTQQLLAPSAVQQLASASTAAVLQQLLQPSSAQKLASASTEAVVQQLAAQQQLASNTAAQQLAPAATALLPSGVGQQPALHQSTPIVEAPANSASTHAGNSRSTPPAPEPVVEEVPTVKNCHLHRKLNKACKFCKAFAAYQESRNKEAEQRRNSAIEKLRETKSSGSLKQDEKAPLPNFSQFSQVLADRIMNTLHYRKFSINQDVPDVKSTLFTCDTCEPEVPSQNTVDMTPSEFFCCVHRLLTLKMTEGQLQGFLNNRSRWVRCAGFLYIRLGMHFDRYWELLSDALMDPEEFVPFPRRGGESITEGQYVEQLLIQEKYCDSKLPRIEAAQRRVINERLVLYEQFRKRYIAHNDDLEYLQDDDKRIPVEVCNFDGTWQPGHTAGRVTPGRRRATVPVRLSDGSERNVSLGMLICPEKRSSDGSRAQDLTCSQGRNNQELLQEWRVKQRGAALSTGKDYCKNSGRHMVHAGGMVFIGGGDKKRAKEKEDSDSEEDERRAKEAKKGGEERREHDLKMKTIMEKYCVRAPQARGQGSGSDEAIDRLRLG